MNEISIDIGYSATKIMYNGKLAKFPTAVSFANNTGLSYGDDNTYNFEGDTYYVGSEATDSEAFVMNDYKMLVKFAPLLVYHVLKKFDDRELSKPLSIKTGLAIVDWANKDEFIERLSTITVNDETIKTQASIIPQGAGCILDYIHFEKNDEYPDRISVIDVGYNTINLVSFVDGRPIRKDIKAYPGHGVSSIIKPFTSYLENTYRVSFSEQEAIQIFTKNKFMYNGTNQEDVVSKITELKGQFVKKLFNSVLVNDKKMLATSDVVLMAGGGSILLEGTNFPPNIVFAENPVFSNVRGYSVS